MTKTFCDGCDVEITAPNRLNFRLVNKALSERSRGKRCYFALTLDKYSDDVAFCSACIREAINVAAPAPVPFSFSWPDHVVSAPASEPAGSPAAPPAYLQMPRRQTYTGEILVGQEFDWGTLQPYQSEHVVVLSIDHAKHRIGTRIMYESAIDTTTPEQWHDEATFRQEIAPWRGDRTADDEKGER